MKGTEFRAALDELSISQKRFSEMVDMDVMSINRWAMDKARIPGVAAAYVRLLLAIRRAISPKQTDVTDFEGVAP